MHLELKEALAKIDAMPMTERKALETHINSPVYFAPSVTHESFIQAVRDLAVEYASRNATGLDAEALARIARAKLLYGRGHFGRRGVTQFGAWHKDDDKHDLIEVCAATEESWIQLAGTTIHELGHVAAGYVGGHGKPWKQACEALGLRRIMAAGTRYSLAMFAPELRMKLATLDKPADGMPALAAALVKGIATNVKNRPCIAGVGVRGGKSRGVGSGSRLRKYVCDGYVRMTPNGLMIAFQTIHPEAIPHKQIIRASTDTLDAHCNTCGGRFLLA